MVGTKGSGSARSARRGRRVLRCIKAVAASVALAIPAASLAFDWNAETGFFQWLLGRQGFFTPTSGHTLATACALDEASRRAAADPALTGSLSRAVGDLLPRNLDQVQFSVPYQLLAFGNWGNEIFTNSSLEGRATHEDAGAFLKGRYNRWLSSEIAQKVYLGTKTGNDYSATYYLHSEAIDGKTQGESFDAVKAHAVGAIRASIENLREADRKGQPLPDFSGGFKGLAPEQCNERCRGLAFLGSVFHVIEDSSASCSGGAPTALGEKGQGCIPGDGHTVIDWTPAGRPQVVSLGDDKSYQERMDVHGTIDGLYTSCNTGVYRYRSPSGQTFDLNPKFDNASLLIEVARAVGTNEDPGAAANRIWNEVLGGRFASPEHRRPLPPTGPTTTTAFGRWIGDVGETLGSGWWQPTTNYTWTWLGRFVAWVDHRYGDADGWSDGVRTAWGTTGGSNVARNAPTSAGRGPTIGPRTGGGTPR